MSTAVEPKKPPLAKKLKLNSYPWYSPRFWHGMCLGDYWKMLARGRFRFHPLRVCMALIIGGCAVGNSAFAFLQRLIYGRRIAATEIKEPPIFIIGHWRSGTTYLHELMVCDQRLSYPTYYECYEPNHFLVTGWFAPTLLWPLLPGKRPMDNMATGWHRPQEDEFALVAMGAPTPYFRMAFPNEPAPYDEFLDMDGCAPSDLERWRADMKRFVQMLTLKKGKRLVMKSPPHTGRIAELARLFPGAKIVHIVRDPAVIFPSTRRLWVSLDAAQGFQHPHYRDLDEYVFSAFERMYRGFNRQRAAIPDNQICELKYEDLVRDPIGQLRRIYEQLELGDFEAVRPAMEKHVGGQKD
ncbi:MAG TPA: sulfotransferase, partial [Pirellulales bacterium]|nr:sulfotransferase [Pirellulales bacterium]